MRHRSLDAFAEINRQLDREASGVPYRGHLIRYNALADTYLVSREGGHICTANTMPLAKEAVDTIA